MKSLAAFPRLLRAILVGACAAGIVRAGDDAVLPASAFEHHVAKFNAMEPEVVVNLVPNAEAQAWLAANVPRFACPDAGVEEIYWFRWWALRKQLRFDQASGRHVFGEFINRARPVSSALGHHLMEGRWLRDQKYHDDYVLYWFRGKGGEPVNTLEPLRAKLCWRLQDRVRHPRRIDAAAFLQSAEAARRVRRNVHAVEHLRPEGPP